MSFTTVPGASASDATTLTGTAGDDSVDLVGLSQQFVVAGEGADTIRVGSGAFTAQNITLKGGAGKDNISAIDTTTAISSAFVNYNAGDDQGVFNTVANSTIHGGQGIDTLVLSTLQSSIFNGNKGNDILEVRASASSSLHGGQGNDTLGIRGTHDASKIFGDLNDDTITMTAGSGYTNSTINGNGGNDSVTLGAIATFSGTSRINGGTGNDTINATGSTVGVTINGDAGNDTMTGSTAADTFTGGEGNDSFQSGAGIDTITGGGGTNQYIFLRSLTAGTDADVITGNGTTDIYALNTATGGALNGIGAGVVDGDGGASTNGAQANGVSANSTVATAISLATAGNVDVSAAGADVLILTVAGGAGVAGGFGGVIAAQNGAFRLREQGGGTFANGNKLISVVEDTTDNQIDIGIVEMDGAGVIDGVELLMSVNITGGVTTASVAANIDFIGLA
jgi:hypothetical protein